ncbi:hypothetical protein K469DRAFT_742280 [Zopfia rhizophila CBS 207.26]|uniref:NAD(P)-binding protein n=1 Tax=Zopfia rhizophila CBS 207.26 TaxID=1314779 RepID=A0A6A6DI84_9PEZI|nr:hypothetical protein K469DRAFT_742280 [Zopfia rhizophila CBS 207.26]
MVAPPGDAILALGSLVLITGVNGYMGCKVADQLLHFGYRVRDEVSDLPKSAWVKERFDCIYGANNFELLEIKDTKAPGALDEAVKSCGAFAHFVSNVTFHPDPNIVVNEFIAFVTGALDSTAKEPALKHARFDLTQQSWNTGAVERAWAPPPYTPDRSFDTYVASKVQAEKALWEYMSTTMPHIEANTILPDFLTGESVNTEKQGLGPTGLFMNVLWDGDGMPKILYPQYMIDAKDNALLHVGALLHPYCRGERVFGYAHRKNWTDWIKRLRKMYPEHDFTDPAEKEGWDLSNIVDQPKAEALIKWIGQSG